MGRVFQMPGRQVTTYTGIEGVRGLAKFGKLLSSGVPIVALDKESGQRARDIAQALGVAVITEKLGMNEMGYQHKVTGRSREGNRAA